MAGCQHCTCIVLFILVPFILLTFIFRDSSFPFLGRLSVRNNNDFASARVFDFFFDESRKTMPDLHVPKLNAQKETTFIQLHLLFRAWEVGSFCCKLP